MSIADDKTKQVSVFDNGKLVRTMPTSMGMGGTQTIAGTTLSFWTPSGVYTVLDKCADLLVRCIPVRGICILLSLQCCNRISE